MDVYLRVDIFSILILEPKIRLMIARSLNLMIAVFLVDIVKEVIHFRGENRIQQLVIDI